jgi:hypothetical protein
MLEKKLSSMSGLGADEGALGAADAVIDDDGPLGVTMGVTGVFPFARINA